MNRIILSIFTLLLVNCKKESTLNNLSENKLIIDSLSDSKNHKENIKNQPTEKPNHSFTIDCGSGCAMTYNEIARKSNANSIEIKYEVSQYIDEKVEDEYFETYIFEGDKNGNLINIHLNSSKENILNDNSSLLKEKLLEVGITLFSKGSINNTNSKKEELVTEMQPYNLMVVPFDLKEYINNLPNEIKNSYTPTNKLIDYLVSKGYEGENYKCFFLKKNDNSSEIIASIARGDSEYFLLITMSDNKFTSSKEIGSIGEETKYFKVDKNFKVIPY